jgi:hypothetical protein
MMGVGCFLDFVGKNFQLALRCRHPFDAAARAPGTAQTHQRCKLNQLDLICM